MDRVMAMLATQAMSIAGFWASARNAGRLTRAGPTAASPEAGFFLTRRRAPKTAPATASAAPAREAAGQPAVEPVREDADRKCGKKPRQPEHRRDDAEQAE